MGNVPRRKLLKSAEKTVVHVDSEGLRQAAKVGHERVSSVAHVQASPQRVYTEEELTLPEDGGIPIFLQRVYDPEFIPRAMPNYRRSRG
jgi:hypothetical protein